MNGLAPAVLADRRVLTEDGMMTIVITIDSNSNKMLSDPIFYNKGLISQGSQTAAKECKELVSKAVNQKLASKTNFAEIKNIVKTVAGDYIFSRTNRRPMIIPVILTQN